MSNRVVVTVSDQRTGNGGGHDVSRWMVAGLTQRGSTTAPTRIRSLAEYQQLLGPRVTYGLLYDAADTFFHVGPPAGAEMWIARVVGPSALAASHTFLDGSSGNALTVKANSVGDWGNGAGGGLSVQITAGGGGGTFVLTVRYGGVVVEASPDLADVTAAIQWAHDNSHYIVVSDPGATLDPAVVAATNLAGGTDDRASVVTANWTAALATLPAALGAGQVSAPGATASAVQQAVVDHANATNRTALLDSTPGASASTIEAQPTALTGELKRAALVAPWAIVPGIVAGSTRSVPYSAVQAGLIASSDAANGAIPAVDSAVAAANGTPRWVMDLETHFTDAELTALDVAKVIPARVTPDGVVQTYGDRSLANASTEPAWYQIQAGRTIMYIADEMAKVGARYVFATLDPALVTVGRLKGELRGVLEGLSPGQIYNDPTTAVTASQDTVARSLTGSAEAQPNQAAETVAIDVIVEAS